MESESLPSSKLLKKSKFSGMKNSEYEKRIDEEIFEILEIDINDS